MMSLEAIRQVNQEIGEVARDRELVPFHFDSEYQIRVGEYQLPNLGDYVPPGYEQADKAVFVDKLGFGAEREPAMTQKQFINHLIDVHRRHPEWGWGVVEEGPFQVYVAPFQKIRE